MRNHDLTRHPSTRIDVLSLNPPISVRQKLEQWHLLQVIVELTIPRLPLDFYLLSATECSLSYHSSKDLDYPASDVMILITQRTSMHGVNFSIQYLVPHQENIPFIFGIFVSQRGVFDIFVFEKTVFQCL